ncbi:MAG TPA: hypothetical protein VNL14_16380 [Candidatus Acidoferrales bacterium]|nr:hypothetical protein [Candidatus Acidoferrales bacterium]
MKLRDLYSDRVFITGLFLLFLGIGNWTVGALESARFEGLVQRAAQTGLETKYSIFRQLDQQKNEEVLRRITEDREKYNAARVKLEFFHVVLVGGQLLFFAGLVVGAGGLLRVIRREGLTKLRRLESGPVGEGG